MLVALANQFLGDKLSTGGDIVAFEVTKRLRMLKTILAPSSIHQALMTVVKDAEFVSTDGGSSLVTASNLSGGIQTLISYLKRAWTSYFWLKKHINSQTKLYLTGDFICNTLPAWIIKQQKPSIKIYANFYHRNPQPAKRLGNPWIVSWSSRWLQTISLFLIKNIAERIFVLSEIGKQELIKEGFPENKLVISGAGADLSFTTKYRHLRKHPRQIAFIGRINNTKGAFELIEILASVAQRNLNFMCKFIGAGSDQDMTRLNMLIDKNNLRKYIEIMGYVSENEKYKTLAQSRVLVLPSKEEGFGIVILEALAVGVPAICFDLPALRTLFGKYPQVTLVPVGNYQGFGEVVIQALKTPLKSFQAKFATWGSVYKIQAKYLYS